MDFYCKDQKQKLNCFNGIDIGRLDPHGGVSNGAIGFDTKSKREEQQYTQIIKKEKNLI